MSDINSSNKGRDLDTIFVECYVGNLRVIDLDVLIREFNLPKTGSKDQKVTRCIRFYKNLQRAVTRTRFVNAVKQLLSARGINVDIESFRATMMPVYADNHYGNGSDSASRSFPSDTTLIGQRNNDSRNNITPYYASSINATATQPQQQYQQPIASMFTGIMANRASGISVPPTPAVAPSVLITLAELGGAVPAESARKNCMKAAPLTSDPTIDMTPPAFYYPVEQITAACRLSTVSVPVNNSFHGCLLAFKLPDEAVELLSASPHDLFDGSDDSNQQARLSIMSQYKLLLRFKATEPITFQADARPENLFIKVNDRLVYHPEHIHQTKKRTEKGLLFRPIELTVDIHGIHTISLEDNNIISISYSPDAPRDYDFTLWVGKKRSVRDLRMLLDECQPPPSLCRQRASSRSGGGGDDDEIAVIDVPEVRLSLKCPVSKTRLIMPCRGQHCQHIQAFDGDTFLSMNERRPTWRCFVCDKIIWFADLYCDSFVKQLALTYADADNLELLLASNDAESTTGDADVLKIVPLGESDTNKTCASQSSRPANEAETQLNGLQCAGNDRKNSDDTELKDSAASRKKAVDVIELSDSDDDNNNKTSSDGAVQDVCGPSKSSGEGVSNEFSDEIGKRSSDAAELGNNVPSKRHAHVQNTSLDQMSSSGTSSFPNNSHDSTLRRFNGFSQPTSLSQIMDACGVRGSGGSSRAGTVRVKVEEGMHSTQPATAASSTILGPRSSNSMHAHLMPGNNLLATAAVNHRRVATNGPAGLRFPPLTATSTAASTHSSGVVEASSNERNLFIQSAMQRPDTSSNNNNNGMSLNPNNNASTLIDWLVSGNAHQTSEHPTTHSPTHSNRSGSFSHFGGSSVPITYDVVSSTFVPVSSSSSTARSLRPHTNTTDTASTSGSSAGLPIVLSSNNSSAKRPELSSSLDERCSSSFTGGVLTDQSSSQRRRSSLQRVPVINNSSSAGSTSSLTQIAAPVQQQTDLFMPPASTNDTAMFNSLISGNDWSALLSQAIISTLYNQAVQQQQQQQQQALVQQMQFQNQLSAAIDPQYADSLAILQSLQAVLNLSGNSGVTNIPLPSGASEHKNNFPQQQFLATQTMTQQPRPFPPQPQQNTIIVSSNNNNNNGDISGDGIVSGEIIDAGTVAFKPLSSIASTTSSSSRRRSDPNSALLNKYLNNFVQHQQQPSELSVSTAASTPVQMSTPRAATYRSENGTFSLPEGGFGVFRTE